MPEVEEQLHQTDNISTDNHHDVRLRSTVADDADVTHHIHMDNQLTAIPPTDHPQDVVSADSRPTSTSCSTATAVDTSAEKVNKHIFGCQSIDEFMIKVNKLKREMDINTLNKREIERQSLNA
jgi:hypothetical protein